MHISLKKEIIYYCFLFPAFKNIFMSIRLPARAH